MYNYIHNINEGCWYILSFLAITNFSKLQLKGLLDLYHLGLVIMLQGQALQHLFLRNQAMFLTNQRKVSIKYYYYYYYVKFVFVAVIESNSFSRNSDPFNEFMKTLKKPAAQDIVQHLKVYVIIVT